MAVSVVLFIMISAVGEYIIRIDLARERAASENRIVNEVSSIRAAIEAELNATLYIGVGLAGYIAVDTDFSAGSVDQMLANIYEYGRHLRNIGLAPNNILTYIYPLEGNKGALGLNFRTKPDQWTAVEQAMRTRQTVVAGPVDLVQGGQAVICRTPVYLEDDSYWGIISIVVDRDSLIDAVEAYRTDMSVEWAVRNHAGRLVYGDGALFEDPAVLQTIALPGTTWELAAAPGDGGADGIWLDVTYRGLGIAIALVISLLVLLVLIGRSEFHIGAAYDSATGLIGRTILEDRLDLVIAHASRRQSTFAVLALDLQGFNAIHEASGPRAGDHVLRESATRMLHILHSTDVLARVGEDEFIAVLPKASSEAEAADVAAQVAEALAAPIRFGGETLTVGTYMALVYYPAAGVTAAGLIGSAEAALEQARQEVASATVVS